MEELEGALIARNLAALNNLAKQAMLEGAQFEREAERCRMEAERAYEDVGSMKSEGRARAAAGAPRMLPSHERAVDVRTNSFKTVGDAKGDVLFYAQQAAMYAQMAAMKFA